MKINEVSTELLIKVVAESETFIEALHKLGKDPRGSGSQQKLLKNRLLRENISFEHFCYIQGRHSKVQKEARLKYNEQPKKHKIPLEELRRGSIRQRIIKENLIPYICSICGLENVWEGKKLTLQLDHIDGNYNNNKLENLRFLCPNCHSQTDTYGAHNQKNPLRDLHIDRIHTNNYHKLEKIKQKCISCHSEIVTKSKTGYCLPCSRMRSPRKVENRPSLETLLKLLETETYLTVGEMFGVSDVLIRKWIRKYGAEPPRKHKNPKGSKKYS